MGNSPFLFLCVQKKERNIHLSSILFALSQRHVCMFIDDSEKKTKENKERMYCVYKKSTRTTGEYKHRTIQFGSGIGCTPGDDNDTPIAC